MFDASWDATSIVAFTLCRIQSWYENVCLRLWSHQNRLLLLLQLVVRSVILLECIASIEFGRSFKSGSKQDTNNKMEYLKILIMRLLYIERVRRGSSTDPLTLPFAFYTNCHCNCIPELYYRTNLAQTRTQV